MNTVNATVNEIFANWPALHGFSVGELDGALSLDDVAVDPWGGDAEELPRHIAEALLELIDEEPDAVQFLRGRTFARSLH